VSEPEAAIRVGPACTLIPRGGRIADYGIFADNSTMLLPSL
jgi:hypothetical protein